MASWYYENDGAQAGPISEAELHSLVASGVISRSTRVWTDGMADWQPASEVPGLFDGGSIPAHTPPVGPYPPPHSGGARPTVDNHLIKAVLITIFCCLPLGVVSIVHAAQVNGKLESGDYVEAQRLSAQANKWANWGLIAGLVVIGLYVLLMVAGLMGSSY